MKVIDAKRKGEDVSLENIDPSPTFVILRQKLEIIQQTFVHNDPKLEIDKQKLVMILKKIIMHH